MCASRVAMQHPSGGKQVLNINIVTSRPFSAFNRTHVYASIIRDSGMVYRQLSTLSLVSPEILSHKNLLFLGFQLKSKQFSF